MRTATFAAVVLATALAWTAPRRASADVDAEAATLGAQTEAAALVVVARATAAPSAADELPWVKTEFEVGRVLRGGWSRETPLVVLLPRALGDAAPAGAARLLFLEPADDGESRYRPVAGSASVLPAGDPRASARLRHVARYAAALAAPASRRDEALRAALVDALDGDDAGVVLSAALDLGRRAELLAGLSRAQSEQVVDVFARRGVQDRAQEALARVVALCGSPRAADALADACAADGAELLRGGLGDAAEAFGGSALAEALAARLAITTAPHRARTLVAALGAAGREVGLTALLGLLRADDATLRAEALHAVGRTARAIRARAAAARRAGAVRSDADADAPPPAEVAQGAAAPDATWSALRTRLRVALAQAALGARTANERRAAVWSLVQLDDPAATSFLRRLARDDPGGELGRLAEYHLARPRGSLVLR